MRQAIGVVSEAVQSDLPETSRSANRPTNDNRRPPIGSGDGTAKKVKPPPARIPAPRIRVIKRQGNFTVEPASPIHATRLLTAFGNCDSNFLTVMINSLIDATCPGGMKNPNDLAINAVLAGIADIAPADATEFMLASQIVATHNAALSALSRLQNSLNIDQQDSNANLAVKLLRAHASLIATLQRYRGKGQQTVTVEHVHVNEGSQAIVGNIVSDASEKLGERTSARQGLTHAPGTPMRSANPEWDAVPISGGSGEAAMQNARGSGRKRRSSR